MPDRKHGQAPRWVALARVGVVTAGRGSVSMAALQGLVAGGEAGDYKRAAACAWRGARVVDRGGLENRCACERTVGSNPTLSAKII